MLLLLAVITYAVVGVFSYGIALAYYQRNYPEVAERDWEEDRMFALCAGLFWIIVAFRLLQKRRELKPFQGLMFRNPHKKE